MGCIWRAWQLILIHFQHEYHFYIITCINGYIELRKTNWLGVFLLLLMLLLVLLCYVFTYSPAISRPRGDAVCDGNMNLRLLLKLKLLAKTFYQYHLTYILHRTIFDFESHFMFVSNYAYMDRELIYFCLFCHLFVLYLFETTTNTFSNLFSSLSLSSSFSSLFYR